jgi:hypothetical protein
MSKAAFFYCTGTAYTFSWVGTSLQVAGMDRWFWGDKEVNPAANPVTTYIKGLNGTVFPWPTGVMNDPFPFMLDSDIWEPERINYADSILTFATGGSIVGGMGSSINDGISKVIARINALPPGKPFAIGGTSQGAAVMSGVYNELRSGSLTSRYPSFLGGVVFGNPRRQLNHRGEIGGTWSGAWDVAGSNTGGHGSFPATGPWARLSGCDGTEWIDFTNPLDVFSSVGDSSVGALWTQANDTLLGITPPSVLNVALQALLSGLVPSNLINAIDYAWNQVGGIVNYIIDAADQQGAQPGGGHVLYAFLPPANTSGIIPAISTPVTTTFTGTSATSSVPGISNRAGRITRNTTATTTTSITHNYLRPDGDTAYQLALKWLNDKAKVYATAPLVIPTTGQIGWSTTLTPPSTQDSKKPRFYWANGTSWLAEFGGSSIMSLAFGNTSGTNIKGLNGKTIYWSGGAANDPFPLLLDSSKWHIQRVLYPATLTSGVSSITTGIKFIVNDILTKPPGTKFAVGGFSGGGAVTHGLIKETRPGGLLEARAADLVAAVTFGAPTREINHTFPGSSGYSGALDVAGSTTGGPGVFPADRRITSTPSWCWDFTMPIEISSGVGDSPLGQAATAATGAALAAAGWAGQLLSLLGATFWGSLTGALSAPAASRTVTDALTGQTSVIDKGGHGLYPHLPPPAANGTIPSSGLTCYQLAAQYLMSVVDGL